MLRLSLRKILGRHLVTITNSIKDIANKSTAFKIVINACTSHIVPILNYNETTRQTETYWGFTSLLSFSQILGLDEIYTAF